MSSLQAITSNPSEPPLASVREPSQAVSRLLQLFRDHQQGKPLNSWTALPFTAAEFVELEGFLALYNNLNAYVRHKVQ